VIKEQGG